MEILRLKIKYVCALLLFGVLLTILPYKKVYAIDQNKYFILDVDMVADTDDIWAIKAAQKIDADGKEKLLAVMMSASDGENALAAYLTYNGRMDIPIDERTDAVKLYRKILAQSEKRVSIVTTGYLTNIKALLESQPDEYSELNGYELVREKVRAIHITGGSIKDHWDNNFGLGPQVIEAANFVFEKWPKEIPVVIYTNDLGAPITIGSDVDTSDPIYTCQQLAGREAGSPAWDIFTVWAFTCMDYNDLRSNHLSLSHCLVTVDENGNDNIVDADESGWWRITKSTLENNWYKQQIINMLN